MSRSRLVITASPLEKEKDPPGYPRVLVQFENSSASKPSSDGFPERVSSPALLALGPAGRLDG